MARHKPPDIQEAVNFDLTPMIDITFQLIIFFIFKNQFFFSLSTFRNCYFYL